MRSRGKPTICQRLEFDNVSGPPLGFRLTWDSDWFGIPIGC